MVHECIHARAGSVVRIVSRTSASVVAGVDCAVCRLRRVAAQLASWRSLRSTARLLAAAVERRTGAIGVADRQAAPCGSDIPWREAVCLALAASRAIAKRVEPS